MGELVNWRVMDEEEYDNQGYTNIHQAWRNTETDAEVCVYRTEGTEMEEVEESEEWATQHPWDDGNVEFFEDKEGAMEFAEEWMEEHPTPENVY